MSDKSIREAFGAAREAFDRHFDQPDSFVLGEDDIPDWFMDRVSTNEIIIYGVRGYLTHATFDQADEPRVQRVRGDVIEWQWLEAVLRPRQPLAEQPE